MEISVLLSGMKKGTIVDVPVKDKGYERGFWEMSKVLNSSDVVCILVRINILVNL